MFIIKLFSINVYQTANNIKNLIKKPSIEFKSYPLLKNDIDC